MKKKICLFIIVVLFVVGIYYVYENNVYYDLEYTQEYNSKTGNIKGNVDKLDLLKYSENFEIGANKYGYAVFKNPDLAFKDIFKLFPNGINAIKKEYNLSKLTKRNFKSYKIYASQLSESNENEKNEAVIVGKILDIYENSFEK